MVDLRAVLTLFGKVRRLQNDFLGRHHLNCGVSHYDTDQARLNQQLALLCSAGTVIYRRFCRVSTCLLQNLVTARILTNAHISFLLAHPDLHERYCQDLDWGPELVASQDKRVRQTPRGGGKDARTHLRVEASNCVYVQASLVRPNECAHRFHTRFTDSTHVWTQNRTPKRSWRACRPLTSTWAHAHTHCIE